MLLAAASWAQSSAAPAQVQAASDLPGAVLTKLFPPVYPPLSRQARISGDVKVVVRVRPDGTVASVEALSGHPLLKPAAVEDAQKSEFECKGCTGETEYLLTYSFGFMDLTREELASYDNFVDRPVRAAKCIYLWKCATVRVNTFDFCTARFPPKISQSTGHVTVLVVNNACVETIQYSTSASR
jgi:TonB family protein